MSANAEILKTLNWLKTQISARLPLAGGTMTGGLLLHGDPTEALGAATKQYVDAKTTVASQEEAQAGTDNTKMMTPSATKQAILANDPGVVQAFTEFATENNITVS
jgi:hypothetical protein